MKRSAILLTVVLFATSTISMGQDQSTRIGLGTIAPGFTVQQINEVPFTLGDEPTIIWFFAYWCDYIGLEYPEMGRDCDGAASRLKAAYDKYGEQFRWIGVSFASLATPKEVGEYRLDRN